MRLRLFKKKIPQLIPETGLGELLNGKSVIEMREPVFQTGNVTLEELSTISWIIKEKNPRAIFEMGTFDGRTTLNIAVNSSQDAKIYTLDLPKEKLDATKFAVTSGDRDLIDKEASGLRFQGAIEAKKITQLYGDTASFDFAPYLNRMDLVFIDASHAYDYVINDTKIALKLLKNKRGTILWHDYGSCGDVTKALNDLYQELPQLRAARHIARTSLIFLSL